MELLLRRDLWAFGRSLLLRAVLPKQKSRRARNRLDLHEFHLAIFTVFRPVVIAVFELLFITAHFVYVRL